MMWCDLIDEIYEMMFWIWSDVYMMWLCGMISSAQNRIYFVVICDMIIWFENTNGEVMMWYDVYIMWYILRNDMLWFDLVFHLISEMMM